MSKRVADIYRCDACGKTTEFPDMGWFAVHEEMHLCKTCGHKAVWWMRFLATNLNLRIDVDFHCVGYGDIGHIIVKKVQGGALSDEMSGLYITKKGEPLFVSVSQDGSTASSRLLRPDDGDYFGPDTEQEIEKYEHLYSSGGGTK